MKKITKKYSNSEVTIVWQAEKCSHSGNCVKNNSEVFKLTDRPWIRPENSSTEKIIETIEKCPSGALTYYLNDTK
jgi:uncharacterized Fe-S cluster protein YjdI